MTENFVEGLFGFGGSTRRINPAQLADKVWDSISNPLKKSDKMACCMNNSGHLSKSAIHKAMAHSFGFLESSSSLYKSIVKILEKKQESICTKYGTAAKGGTCDEMYQDFCRANKDDPRCSCYNTMAASPNDSVSMQALKANPLCWSNACLMNGYQPYSLKNRDCPHVTVCKNQASTFGNSNISQDNITVITCTPDGSKPGSGSQGGNIVSSGSGGSTVTQIMKEKAEEKRKALITYVVLGLIVFVVLYMTVFKDSDADEYDEYGQYNSMGSMSSMDSNTYVPPDQ